MAAISHLEKTPDNGSRPAAGVKYRLTSGPTGISRVTIIACFVMQILLPAWGLDEGHVFGKNVRSILHRESNSGSRMLF